MSAPAPASPVPARTILRWYKELGGEILTLGSDCHRVEHLGVGLEVGAELARAAGFRRVCTFERATAGLGASCEGCVMRDA